MKKGGFNVLDMETLGYFLFMEKQEEKQHEQEQEDEEDD